MDTDSQFLGVVQDPRTEVQKAQDFQHAEIAAAAPPPVEWIEKPADTLRCFPKRDQDGSSSCMAQSGAKALGIENVVEEGTFVELSALPVYRFRENFPGTGMYQKNLLSLLSKPNACLEKQAPSQAMNEDEMNAPIIMTEAMRNMAEYYRANGYVFLPANNIDEMARVLDQGKAVHLLMYFAPDEWWKPMPEIKHEGLANNDPISQHHGITAVDRTLYNRKKALVIEDSAGGGTTIDGSGQRIVTEDFIKARCYGAGYLISKKNGEEIIPKPSHHFVRALEFGMTNDPEVAALQKILQYEKFLPDTINGAPLPLGNMLQMTCVGLKKWGVAHGIMDYANEPDVRKVRFGPKSIALANSLYP